MQIWENCDKKLCQFKHSQNKQKLKENNLSKNNTERVDDLEKEDTIYEDDQLTEKEKEFELYVKTNFRRVFDYILQNKKHTPCYFCDYVSKTQILNIGADEISDHLEEEHQEIIAEFNPDSSRVFDYLITKISKKFTKALRNLNLQEN